ncbi:uncharacterized protein [Primulina huaijiensis]|uniref:uncharacterized protein n=1 Tax=Primulina huaijiensis TaxID=1492673 RepID=UPI003CC71028
MSTRKRTHPEKSMASKIPKLFIFFFIFHHLITCSSSFPTASNPEPTVYELLPKYGLPSGLLPDSVTNYTLDQDGNFEVNLKKPCYIKFEYTVYYEKKITGKLSIGSITDLKGIEVQSFFFWFNVGEIKVDLPPSHSIYFSVGIIDKKLDVDQFLTVRSCKDKAFTLKQLPVPRNYAPMLLAG